MEPMWESVSVQEEVKNLHATMEKHLSRQELLMEELTEQLKQCVKRFSKENVLLRPRGSVQSGVLDMSRLDQERSYTFKEKKASKDSNDFKEAEAEVEDSGVRETIQGSHRNSARMSFARNFFTDHMQRARDAAAAEFGSTTFGDVIEGVGSSRVASIQSRALRIVTAPITAHFVMALILLNLILLGVEVDVSATLGANDIPGWFEVVNAIIVLVFVAELSLMIVGYGPKKIFFGRDRWWNIFDFAIVALSAVETFVQFSAPGLLAEMRYMRFLRLARALRGMRVVKLLRYVSALRTLIFSIISTTGSLLWTLVLLLLIFYCFGVILTQIVTDFCREQTINLTNDPNAIPRCPAELQMYWSSIPESILTLYMAISGGVSWIEPLQPLREVSALAVGCMLLYVVLTVFAVLNVVTGVFCHTAIESATKDKEIVVMSQIQKQRAQASALREMFKEIDVDDSAMVSVQELRHALKTQKMSSFLESMDISTQDVWTLFMIIDSDQNGLIDVDEFVTGCQNLHGPAKSIQIARMSHENKVTRQTIKKLIAEIGELKNEVHQWKRDVSCGDSFEPETE